jgi:uncharacterized membrane protein YkoI
MKYLTLLVPMFVFASGATLTPSEHSSVHGYNKRPVAKIQQKQNMHKLHKIDEEEAKKIVRDKTNEEVISLKLSHTGNKLIYKAKTKHHSLIINALDGGVIKDELIGSAQE